MKKAHSADEIINEFNNRFRLSDFISKYIQLNPRGNSYIGKCPFHNDKTPSFSVSDEKGLYHCFGCKEGGNIISFISKFKNYSFPETLNFLANYMGIEIKYSNNQNNRFKKNYDLLDTVNSFFQENLLKSNFQLEYIKKRIRNEKLINFFNIGLCPNEKSLKNFLISKKFSDIDIQNSGLFIKKQDRDPFGRFSDRITFPIFNFANKIVGFGARAIKESKIKYINSPESEIFKKGEILYGLKQNVEFIREKREIILLEGYLDVISLHERGIKNTVATLGTTLSQTQVMKMWNFSDVPFICFDGDLAGINAAKKIARKIIEFLIPGKSLKFIFLPDGHDPDSFIISFSKEEFELLKKKSLDLSEIIWDLLQDPNLDKTPENMALLDEKIIKVSNTIQNKTVSKEYFKFLKNQKDQFYWNQNKYKFSSKKFNETRDNININLNDKILLMFLFFDLKLLEEFHEEISSLELGEKKLEFIRKFILEKFANLDQPEFKEELQLLKDKNKNLIEELIFLEKTHIKNLKIDEKKTFFKQVIRNLRLPIIEKERENLKNEIISCKDQDRLNKLIKKYDEINNEIKSIRNKILE